MAIDRRQEVHHPDWREYTVIGVILTIITAVEVAIVYIEAMGRALLPALLTLSVIKFILVVAWYMHLKQDSKLFSLLFLGGLFMSMGVIMGLLAMFGVFD